eukprot:1796129-Prymnesium_polylepis.1
MIAWMIAVPMRILWRASQRCSGRRPWWSALRPPRIVYTPTSESGDSGCACARGRRVRGRRV